MRVLAVGAHPDDLEILAAGTLARFHSDGHHVTMCHVASGNRGSYDASMEETASTRLAEARAAAAQIGATHVTLGVPDCEVDASDPAQRRLAVDLVRRERPDLVITHPANDYMGDHNEVSRLVFDASFFASVPLLETGEAPHDIVPALYHMDTLNGLGFVPTEYVDISDTIDTKTRMLQAHTSQLAWLREHDGVDIVADMRTAAAYRGLQSGVAFAEGFTACLTSLRVRTHRLLP
ncbi:MAG: PIG-L family deacetylase [Actinomycetota bacterium]|nr:PIG-L family deacetylase [Actinomycetota bacterium]